MPIDEARLQEAIEALADRERLREAEATVIAAAPKLQGVLAAAMEEGGWLGDARADQVRRAATAPGEDERITAVRTLLAEEARIGIMVGVAVGWALAGELNETRPEQEE
jgi:hypothetical protein